MRDLGPRTSCRLRLGYVMAARSSVLRALQYDRRPQDLPLLRFLLQQETAFYEEEEEVVPWGWPGI